MRRLVVWLLIAVSSWFPLSSFALNSWGTDLSDWWYTVGEDGWAVNVAHESDTLFIAMFVYGPDRKATWYSGALASLGGTSEFTFTGTLYETTGPFFGGSFSPLDVTRRTAGTATIAFTSVNSADLTYSIDNTNVSKSLGRFTFKSANLAGSYLGAIIGTVSGCPSNNGAYSDSGNFTVTHSGSTVSVSSVLSSGSRCSYSGAYTQNGRMGSISGTFSCSNGASGNFSAFEIESGYNALVLRYTVTTNGTCRETGRMGGMKF